MPEEPAGLGPAGRWASGCWGGWGGGMMVLAVLCRSSGPSGFVCRPRTPCLAHLPRPSSTPFVCYSSPSATTHPRHRACTAAGGLAPDQQRAAGVDSALARLAAAHRAGPHAGHRGGPPLLTYPQHEKAADAQLQPCPCQVDMRPTCWLCTQMTAPGTVLPMSGHVQPGQACGKKHPRSTAQTGVSGAVLVGVHSPRQP